jgi:hypothetical protein
MRSSVLYDRYFIRSDCDTDQYLEVENIREGLSESLYKPKINRLSPLQYNTKFKQCSIILRFELYSNIQFQGHQERKFYFQVSALFSVRVSDVVVDLSFTMASYL